MKSKHYSESKNNKIDVTTYDERNPAGQARPSAGQAWGRTPVGKTPVEGKQPGVYPRTEIDKSQITQGNKQMTDKVESMTENEKWLLKQKQIANQKKKIK